MKKIILLTACLLFIFSSAYSQKELWGLSVSNDGTSNTFGSIYKTDINGQNVHIIHSFDEVHGKMPKARLFLASNGKLYGTANRGGNFYTQADNGGVLFEYDMTLNLYRVVANFGGDGLMRNPFSDLIEPVPGVLIGATERQLFRYDIATEVTTIIVTMPIYNNGNINLYNNVNPQFLKASDGFVYASSMGMAGCGGSTTQAAGTIIKINPANNAFSQPYIFPCNGQMGYYPAANLVEGTPGKLYGTTQVGGVNDHGTIFEYNTITNSYTKKFDFNQFVSGRFPGNLINGGNGKLYGITTDGGTDPCNPNQHLGTFFEYDLANSIVTILAHMGCDMQGSSTMLPHGSLLKASNGYIFGMSNTGMFKYDIAANTMADACPQCPFDPYYRRGFSEGVIEVCRKPTYNSFEVSAFTACQNTTFVFSIQNTNVTSYIWKKGSVILPAQTTAILNIANLTPADAGIYTCTMTNECGTTVTTPLQLTVDACLGLDEVLGFKNAIKLYPNPVNNILNIKLPDAANVAIQKVSVSNMLGQTVHASTGNTTAIDISTLAKGMYQLLLTTDKGNWNGRFFKE